MKFRLVAITLDQLEIERCKFLGVFTEGYPLHDCTLTKDEPLLPTVVNEKKEEETPNGEQMRRHLHNNWAQFSNWKLFQPFDAIQVNLQF